MMKPYKNIVKMYSQAIISLSLSIALSNSNERKSSQAHAGSSFYLTIFLCGKKELYIYGEGSVVAASVFHAANDAPFK